jgi:NADH dehydrogenase FAD-containing subunit
MRGLLVEALSQALPGYFDEEASQMIYRAFSDSGVKILLERMAVGEVEASVQDQSHQCQ